MVKAYIIYREATKFPSIVTKKKKREVNKDAGV
jgi:hypothetical protein